MRNKLKSALAVTLLATMTAGVIGCAKSTNTSNGSEQAASPSTEKKQIELVVTSLMGDEARLKLMDETIKIFNKKRPDVTIKYTGNGADYDKRLKLAYSSGEGQDVVYVDDRIQQMLQQNNYLMDITSDVKERGWLDKQLPGAVEFNNRRTPDQYFSVPYLMAPIVVYYNKDIFDKLGLKAPTTIDEFNNDLAKLKESGYTPMENGGLNNFSLLWSLYSVIFGQTPIEDVSQMYYMKGITPAMDTGFLNSLKMVDEWVDKGYFRKDMSSSDYNAQLTFFAKGDIGMLVDGDWDLSAVQDMGFNVGVFSFPRTNESLPNTIVNATDGAWALNAELSDEKKQAALDFIDNFMDPEVIKIWAEGGITPSVKYDASTTTLTPLRQELNAAVTDTQIGFYLDNMSPGFLDIFTKETQRMMLNEITPEECWANLKKEYEKAKKA